MGIAEGIVAAGTLGGALISSHGASKAADAGASAANSGTPAQLYMNQLAREDQAPWKFYGTKALDTLWWDKLAKGPGEFNPEEEPGYKFGYGEFVEKPTLRTAAATGLSQSGRTLKSLSRYASDYASTKYDNFLDRYYKSLDPYYRLAGQGSNVAIAGGQQAISTGQGIANTLGQAGQAKASGYLNQGNIWSNAASGTSQNALDSYYYNNSQNSSTPWYLQQQNQW